MTPSQFIDAIRSVVSNATGPAVIGQLKAPAGRRPREDLVRLSTWFNRLSESDRQFVAEVAVLSARQTTFGFLCVLDGVRAIGPGMEKAELHLTIVEEGKPSVRLTPPKGEMLHDIFNSML